MKRSLIIQGHRGCAAQWPENSIEGVCAAFAAGAFAVEVDVQLSADGVPMVVHDDRLLMADYNLTVEQGASVAVSSLTAQALGEVRFGDRRRRRFAHLPPEREVAYIPTLEALLTHPGVQPERINIELKTAEGVDNGAFASSVVDLLSTLDLLPWRVKSFNYDLLEAVFALRPRWPLHALMPESLTPEAPMPLPNFMNGPSVDSFGVCMHYSQINQGRITECTRLRLHLSVYTVNEADVFFRLRRMGVNDIISDNPALLSSLVIHNEPSGGDDDLT